MSISTFIMSDISYFLGTIFNFFCELISHFFNPFLIGLSFLIKISKIY